MAETEKPIFIGSVSYLLSERNYLDFIRGGLNVNQLPLLSQSIAGIQTSLDDLRPRQMQHVGGSAVYSDDMPANLRQFGSLEPFEFEIKSFFIESVTFESGSVYAKIRIVAIVAFAGYQAIGVYPDVKDGFAELRSDIIQIVNEAFKTDGAGVIEGQQPADDAELRYYFIQPKRIEEEVLKRRVTNNDNE
jgi:hypothetical protein